MNNEEKKAIKNDKEKTTEEKAVKETTAEGTTEEQPAKEKKTWKQQLTRPIPPIWAWIIVGGFAIASLITMIILINI